MTYLDPVLNSDWFVWRQILKIDAETNLEQFRSRKSHVGIWNGVDFNGFWLEVGTKAPKYQHITSDFLQTYNRFCTDAFLLALDRQSYRWNDDQHQVEFPLLSRTPAEVATGHAQCIMMTSSLCLRFSGNSANFGQSYWRFDKIYRPGEACFDILRMFLTDWKG